MLNISLPLFGVIFLVSLVLTMVGLGGGLIFSPLFILLGMAKAQAASASLFLNMVASASAAYTYSKKQMVSFSLAIPLLVSSSIAAPFGSYCNARIDTRPYLVIMAIVMALAALRMLTAQKKEKTSALASTTRSKRILGGSCIGLCIGLAGGFLGIGGGIFIVPLLIYFLGVPTKVAAASSTFIVCFSSLSGFLGYASMQSVNWRFIVPAALASVVGGQIGARIMSSHLQGRSIKVLFGLVLLFFCAQLLYRALG